MKRLSLDIPELNMRVFFQASYVSGGWTNGCHTGSISHTSLSVDGLEPYAYLDKKEGAKAGNKLKFIKGDYGYHNPTPELATALTKYFKDKEIGFKDFPDAFSALEKKLGTIPIWFLSDVINYGSPERGSLTNKQYPVGGWSLAINGRTCDFAKYLIDNKIGYIFSSPIIQNPNHRSKGKYSLNQAWMWIPPAALPRTLDVSEEMGRDQFPEKEDWMKTIGEDLRLNLTSPTFSLDVSKQVFEGGVFPERQFRKKAA